MLSHYIQEKRLNWTGGVSGLALHSLWTKSSAQVQHWLLERWTAKTYLMGETLLQILFQEKQNKTKTWVQWKMCHLTNIYWLDTMLGNVVGIKGMKKIDETSSLPSRVLKALTD